MDVKGAATFLETLKTRSLFEPGTRVVAARAPGRLDVMGGIADYSGSLVLQRPIAESTFAALHRIDEPEIRIVSLGRPPHTVRLDALAGCGYAEARELFRREPGIHWASYVAGLFLVLMRERGITFSSGADIVISSEVPEGKGVSSSAALEAAVMQAVCGAWGLRVDSRETALLCQKAENLVAGAPCGVMDQMTCICGEAGALLSLLCQPAELQAPAPTPDELEFWGIDSGERHAVSGSDYASVRAGAFMGLRIMMENDPACPNYLANVSPAEFEREFLRRLPEEISGAEFLARYSGTADAVTQVDPARVYKVRRPAAHPVYEHQRVRMFRQLFLAPQSEEQRILSGQLMYESHESYAACGLGSRGTDLIVDLVRREGAANGLYGARITGGGCGGAVAVLGRREAHPAIRRVIESYEERIGYRPYVFSGSSDGAAKSGFEILQL